jgi:hypothetical protein
MTTRRGVVRRTDRIDRSTAEVMITQINEQSQHWIEDCGHSVISE